MDFEEKMALAEKKQDELKKRISEAMEARKAAYKADKKDAMIWLSKMDDAIDEYCKNVEAQLYCDMTDIKAEAHADVEAVREAVKAAPEELDNNVAEYEAKMQVKLEDDMKTIKGEMNAAEENFRILQDRYHGKLNSELLKIQMQQDELIKRIEAAKTKHDIKTDERLFNDLVAYADNCQMMAYAYAMEAELAMADANSVMEEYYQLSSELASENA